MVLWGLLIMHLTSSIIFLILEVLVLMERQMFPMESLMSILHIFPMPRVLQLHPPIPKGPSPKPFSFSNVNLVQIPLLNLVKFWDEEKE